MEEDSTAPYEGFCVKGEFYLGEQRLELGDEAGLASRPFYRRFGTCFPRKRLEAT